MKHFILKRICENDGTFGALLHDNVIVCLILERKWKENKPFESCIPASEYICRKVKDVSVSIGSNDYTYEIANVPDRYGILFHIGNIEDDTAGCLLTGEKVGTYKFKNAVLNSGSAFGKFIKYLGEDEIFHLEIQDMK